MPWLQIIKNHQLIGYDLYLRYQILNVFNQIFIEIMNHLLHMYPIYYDIFHRIIRFLIRIYL